jgi:hypothetical protein
MMHSHRCGNGCRFFGKEDVQFPAGFCRFGGIILSLKPDVRRWIELRGCCSFMEEKK